uniref:BTB domain-containing protein n=1 Tax=Panagrolaimus davidi TaxID=227884 RepID=A0A914PWI4_9BILA
MPVEARYRPLLDSATFSIQHQAKFSTKQLKDSYRKTDTFLRSSIKETEGTLKIKHNHGHLKHVEICSKADLFNPEKKYIVDDEFVLEINGILFVETQIPEFVEHPQSLTHILWSLDDKDFILSVGKKNQVHKFVFGSRSTVFNAMMKTDMKEKTKNKTEIIESKPKIVEAVIAFCYDQKISEFLKSETNLCSIFQFANKYDMQVLMSFLEPYFTDNVTPENICLFTATVFMTSSQKLQEFCRRILKIFLKQGISVENIQILDNDFVAELSEKID